MATDAKLEGYLTALDKALSMISVSDRADILTEIKSHILAAQEKNPDQSTASLLAAMGDPEVVANRYLLERGLKPHKHGRTSVVKWLTIGFLGTFGIACAAVVLLIWKLSPLISVDEKNERVQILGGLIDVDGRAEKVKIGKGWTIDGMEASKFDGAKKLTAQTKEIRIPFSNAKLTVGASTDGQIHWNCQVVGTPGQTVATEAAGIFTLNLEKAMGAECDIQLPSLKSTIHGANGKVDLVRPQSELDVNMANGKVAIEQDQAKQYKFDLTVANGKVETFNSSDAIGAIAIKVNLGNGEISREEGSEEETE